MRVFQISSSVMMFMLLSVLFVTGCDTREEKIEYIPPVQGDLLRNGHVPKISPEGAAEIKEMIQNISFVKQYSEMLSMISKEEKEEMSEHLEFRGEFEVIPRTDHYEVVFPDRTTIMPPEGEEEFKSIEIFHKIGLRVRPTGDPSAFRVEFAAEEKPIYAVMNKEDGEEIEFMNFTFESGEEFQSLWHNDLQMFAQMTGSMLNATFTLNVPEDYQREFDGIDKFSVTLSDVISNAMLTPDENNIWSGPYNSSIGKILVELPQDVGHFTILNFDAIQNFQKLNPVVYSEFFSTYDKIMGDLYSEEASEAEDGKDADVDIIPLLKAYKSMMIDGFESADMKVLLSNISVKLNKTPETAHTMKEFGLEEISLESAMSGAKENKANLDFAYTLKGISVGLKQFEEEFGGETPQELVPENISFGMGFENLPVVTLMDKAIAIMEEAGDDPRAVEKTLMTQYPEFINLLSEADAKVKINDSYVGNDVWLLLVNGIGRMSPQSAMKIEGETEVRFYGMDYLMQIMDQRLKNPNTAPPVKMMLEQYATGLGMMQMFGQQKKDNNGRGYRGYTLTLSPEGNVQMNGTDMTQMMGMMR